MSLTEVALTDSTRKMFTMPVIHHSSLRADDGCMGTMHLNALNGSGTECSEQKGVFGNLFGSSVTDSHFYKPQDSGLSFYDSENTFALMSSSLTSSGSEINSRHLTSERSNPVGQRRRSLDLNAMSTNPHPRFKDRSLSVGEITIGPISRFDAIYENELANGLNLDDLHLREASRRSSDSQYDSGSSVSDSFSKSYHASHKKKSRHASDTGLSSKSVKLLEKIKDNINHKHSRNKTEGSHDDQQSQTTSSKPVRLKHNKTRHHTDSTQEKQEQSSHHHKERKHAIRANAD